MEYYKELRAEINKQKTLQDKTNKDLAKETNLALSTIAGFMGGKRYSKLVDEKVREALGIKEDFAVSRSA